VWGRFLGGKCGASNCNQGVHSDAAFPKLLWDFLLLCPRDIKQCYDSSICPFVCLSVCLSHVSNSETIHFGNTVTIEHYKKQLHAGRGTHWSAWLYTATPEMDETTTKPAPLQMHSPGGCSIDTAPSHRYWRETYRFTWRYLISAVAR